MRHKRTVPTTILLVALLIVVGSFSILSYTGYTIHLGGQPNKLIVHYFGDFSGPYTYISIINIAPVSQVVTLKFLDRTGSVLASTNNTVQTNAVWVLASGSGAGPGGTRGREGYLLIEADDVSSLRAEAFLFFPSTSTAIPLTVSSTLYSPYGPQAVQASVLVQAEPTPASTPQTTTGPDTTLTANPRSTSISTSAAFSFTSNQAGSTFECKLDSGSFESCTSPKRYTGLSRSLHAFSVRAKDAAGNVDATPATFTWSII